MTHQLACADDVIDALGGTAETARITGRSQQAISNWRARGSLPPETYLVMQAALAEIGLEAPPAVWRMDAPSSQAQGAA